MSDGLPVEFVLGREVVRCATEEGRARRRLAIARAANVDDIKGKLDAA
jgi:hypothetical protein